MINSVDSETNKIKILTNSNKDLLIDKQDQCHYRKCNDCRVIKMSIILDNNSYMGMLHSFVSL